MGNSLNNQKDNPLFSICKNETQFDPFNQKNSFNHAQNKMNQQKPVNLNLVQRSALKSNLNINLEPINHSQSKQMYSTTKKIKRVQLSARNTKAVKVGVNLMKEQLFHQRLERACKFLKSLKIFKLFQLNFNLSFPLLILNKSQSVTSLRRQIYLQKQNHSFFSSSEPKISSLSLSDQKSQIQYNQARLKYHWFQILQKLEKNVARIFETGSHQKLLKQILHLDHIVGSNPNEFNIKCLQQFLCEIDKTNIQFLDMLYYQLSFSEDLSEEHFRKLSTGRTNKKGKIPLLDVKQLLIEQSNKKGAQSQYERLKNIGLQLYKKNKVCFYILAAKNQSFFTPLYKSDSSQVSQYSQQQNLQSDGNTNDLEFCKLDLPKTPVLLETILQKYNALAQLLELNEITIIILANESKIQKINILIVKNLHKWSKLNLIVLRQTQMPCLDLQGNLILSEKAPPKKSIMKMSTGSGDLWDLLSEDQNHEGLSFLAQNQFEYIEVISVENSLEHGFDCFMLGYMKNQSLQWGTKVTDPCNHLSQLTLKQPYQHQRASQMNQFQIDLSICLDQSQDWSQQSEFYTNQPLTQIKTEALPQFIPSETLIYQNQQGQVCVLYENEQNYDRKLSVLSEISTLFYTFTNHSIFSVDFIKNNIRDPSWKQKVAFKKKFVKNKQNGQKIIAFQKDMTNIFELSTKQLLLEQSINQNRSNFDIQKSFSGNLIENRKFMLFKYQRHSEYYPLIFKHNNGFFDIEGCSKALSKNFLSFLDISVQKYLSSYTYFGKSNFLKCYIDPHVSLEGEDLDQIKLQIERRLNEILVLKQSQSNSSNNLKSPIFQISQLKAKISREKYKDDEIELQNQQSPSRLISSVTQICIDLQVGDKKAQNNENEQGKFQSKIQIYIN